MIRFENVTKIYRANAQKRVVLDRVTSTLDSSRSYGILGPNGAGKSTIMRMIADGCPDIIVFGSVINCLLAVGGAGADTNQTAYASCLGVFNYLVNFSGEFIKLKMAVGIDKFHL